MSAGEIRWRIERGRLFPLHRGVYAVGRPAVTQLGRLMAAVLVCGPHALLSHASALALWRMLPARASDPIHVSVPSTRGPGRSGLMVRRRTGLAEGDAKRCQGIPVTAPALALIDAATTISAAELEAAIAAADKLDLVDPESLRAELERRGRRPGTGPLRRILDRATFALTDSELERRFLPIARRAGLGRPLTQHRVNGFVVDFYWPDLGLVVETDGLRYHRTAAQQARDRVRDQRYAAAGLTPLRFTHAQVRYEPGHVRETLARVAARLRGA